MGEGSHWYIQREGRVQRYFSLKKDGTPRANVMRGQAMQDGAVESVTTILRFIGESGGLVHWASNHGIAAGLNVGMSAAASRESADELIRMAKEEWKTATERAANEGTVIHDSIEKRLSSGDVSDDPIQKQAQDDAEAWVRDHDSTKRKAEHCLIYRGEQNGVKLAFGGTTDLIMPQLVADFKTVESGSRGFREPKATEAAQLAAYRLAGAQMGLCEAGADCFNLYFDRVTGKMIRAFQWPEAALKHGLHLLCMAVNVRDVWEKIDAMVERRKGA
jgi:hypothetical protein